MKIQILSLADINDSILNNIPLNDYCISIGDPGEDGLISTKDFKEVLRLEFHDIDTEIDSFKKPARIDDIKEIIDFYKRTSTSAKGYTIHCHAGISRSSAIALILFYLESRSEQKAMKYLLEIHPYPKPNKMIIELFDQLIESNLQEINNKIHQYTFEKEKSLEEDHLPDIE